MIHAIKVPPTAITLSIRITCVLIELLWRNHQICSDPQHLYCIRAITIQIQVGEFKVTLIKMAIHLSVFPYPKQEILFDGRY